MTVRANLYIDGRWKEAAEYEPLYAPYSGEPIAEVAQADERGADEAIRAAQAAARTMAAMPAHERAAILERAAALIEAQSEELARLVAREAGKPVKTARGELERTVHTYKFSALEARRICGETIPLDAVPGGEGRIAFTVRKPIGVVGAITPFNFPFNLVAHKVGPAIAAGNTVVLKPAEQTPLSALALAEIFAEAGLPAGALNVIPGRGAVVGEALVQDERVAMITFTGSPRVGIAIKNKAGLKRVTLELGSNSALIIDRDVDITPALIDRIIFGAFSYSGQVCISIQRILVHERLYEEVAARLKEAAERLVIGDPLDEKTDLSALISPREVTRMAEWVAEAVARGAGVLTGGRAISDRLYPPTILTGVPADARVSCQEVFGPIVTLAPFAALDEAIRAVNDSRYGLQAGIFTKDVNAALRAARELEVGGVMINDIPTFRADHMPYGGVKESGVGREGVRYAVEEMTDVKLISIKAY